MTFQQHPVEFVCKLFYPITLFTFEPRLDRAEVDQSYSCYHNSDAWKNLLEFKAEIVQIKIDDP